MNPKRNILFTLAFIEGASVMACELFSAKMIAPFFGGSLYVWAAVLGITLLALMSGYYLGGSISAKATKKNLVYWILILAGFFLMIMPHTSIWIMTLNLDLSVQMGSTISLLVFMFPPLVLMGMTSPIIINMINTQLDETGKSAGSVYAISTLGGIIATFLVGFYLLPEFGIKWPCFIFGLILMCAPIFVLLQAKYFKSALIFLPVIYVGYANSVGAQSPNENIKIIYESEGVLGQIRVIDMMYQTASRGWMPGRALMVNNTAQTIMDLNNPEYDLWDWSYYFPTAVSIYPEGSDVLLLGLGGGTLVQQFDRLKFNVDVVEIDQRVKDVAIEYFYIDPETNIIIDDARRYINTCEKKYDVITLDLFLNETPPGHVLTVESFKKIKALLNPEGMVMMNFYGYISGEKGRASRCILKTFEAAGFYVDLLATPGAEANRNLIFLASLEKKNFDGINYSEPHSIQIINLEQHFVNKATIDMTDALVLTDNQPILEKIYIPAALDWRKSSIDYNLKPIIQNGVELVK
ncbi:MAG: fused MFS/spermidine synthase [Crocinitomicaceae bacterium]|nr:fused MFS/spermidine synthase [Crocinitomicaceae bacterium]